MSEQDGEDTPATKRKRLPHAAAIDRAHPFRAEDFKALEDQCIRITNGREFHITRKWDRDLQHDIHVVHFAEPHQARALTDWIWRERFAERPRPEFGPADQERMAFEQMTIAWGVRTGALRRVVQAYRHAMFDKESLTRCHSAAQQALQPFLPPPRDHYDMTQVMVSWAMREHYHWFHGYRPWAKEALRPADWYPPSDAYPHSEE